MMMTGTATPERVARDVPSHRLAGDPRFCPAAALTRFEFQGTQQRSVEPTMPRVKTPPTPAVQIAIQLFVNCQGPANNELTQAAQREHVGARLMPRTATIRTFADLTWNPGPSTKEEIANLPGDTC